MSAPLYNGGLKGAIDEQRRPYIPDDGNWSLQGTSEQPDWRALLLIVDGVNGFGYRPQTRRERFEEARAHQGVFLRSDLLAWRGPQLTPGSQAEMILTGGEGPSRDPYWDVNAPEYMEWGSQSPNDASQTVLATTGVLLVREDSRPPEPITPEPEPPAGTLIGSQHGITAMCNNWRSVWPNWTNPSRDPDNLGTWKAIDKLERTLLILAEDHDASLQ